MSSCYALATKWLAGQFSAPQPGAAGGPDSPTVDPWSLPPVQAHPAWMLGQPLSMHIHFSTSNRVFSAKEKSKSGERLPSVVWENITFGDWNEARSVQLN